MVYPNGGMNTTSTSSNCSSSTHNNSNNSCVTSAANSTKISPSSSGITTPTRVSIKEANDHLQLLHCRVSELEEIIRSQSDQEEIYRRQLKELKSAKETQIDELTKTIVRLEERLKDLESSINQKNEKLEENQIRLTQVDQLSNFLPSLEDLFIHLKQVTLTEKNVISPISSSKELTLNNNLPLIGFSNHQDINNSNNNNDYNNNNKIDVKSENNNPGNLYDKSSIDIEKPDETHSSLIDIACQTEVTGCVGGLVKSDLNGISEKSTETNDLITAMGISSIGSLCAFDPSYSKRSSIDETNNNKEKSSPDKRPTTLAVNEDGIDPVWNSDKQIRNSRSNRSRRVRKSASAINYPLSSSKNWEKDFYCGPSLTNLGAGPGRSIGYKVHSNGSSNISGKIERSFSITSNFSEDEDFPSNGSRGYHK